MLRFLWSLISDDERSEDAMALLTVAFSVVFLSWILLV